MYKSIVIAVDGSTQANKSLCVAAEMAIANNAELSIVHVVDARHSNLSDSLREMTRVEHLMDEAPITVVNYTDVPEKVINAVTDVAAETQKMLFRLSEFIISRAENDAKKMGVESIDTSIEVGRPTDKILSYAKSRDADLIVCGSRGNGPLKSMLLGSTSSKLAQQSECSCLIVK